MAATTTPTASAKSTATKRKPAAAKRRTATTARRKTSTTAKRTTRPAPMPVAKTPVEQVQEIAERALLVNVGVALATRDRVMDLLDVEGSRQAAETQLKRFERRGATARTRAKREVKRTRGRVERAVGQRRTRIERGLRAGRDDLATNLTSSLDRVADQLSEVAATPSRLISAAGERVRNLV